jgi:arsenite/tail-anchored protein-transporting ATPase
LLRRRVLLMTLSSTLSSSIPRGGPVPGGGVLDGLLGSATEFLFFTGKGGVGKTSTAAAASIALAEAGARVLIVSTDPASNLDEVLGVDAAGSASPVPVPGVGGLEALNIDPQAAAAAYRERVVGPYRGVLPVSAIAQMDEELSGACTVEIAAFNEFVALLTDPTSRQRHDHVVFDTAPTGHTLRLLTLPGAWTGFVSSNTSGVTCIGPVSALGRAQEQYGDAVAALRDPARTTVILVARPDPATLAEAARASTELRALGLAQQRLIVNGVLDPAEPDPAAPVAPADPVAVAWRERTRHALASLPPALTLLAGVDHVPLLADAPLGVPGLRRLLNPTLPRDPGDPAAADRTAGPGLPAGWQRGLGGLIDDLAAAGPGVVMTMGKGGVGKTTLAAAIAVELSRRGHPVTLTTTDPAAHVATALPDPPTGLRVARIDPAVETAAYTRRVLTDAAAGLSSQAYALLEEDLRSPCTEEIAVFQAFAATVAEATDRFVVIDTAPTGHTLLLMDATSGYTRQLAQQAGHAPDAATGLLSTLADPTRTRVLLVTLPEATPVHEAAQLQADLARAGITPYAWIVNASLAATTTSDPVLAARGRHEQRWLTEIQQTHATRSTVLPWTGRAPVGAAALHALAAT